MEFFTTALLATAFIKVAEKLADKAIVEPALKAGLEPFHKWLTRGYEAKKAEAELQKAFGDALTKIGAPTNRKNLVAWYKQMGLMRLQVPENHNLRKKVVLAVINHADEQTPISNDLLTEMGWPPSSEKDLGIFLTTLRANLAGTSWKPFLDYADNLAVRKVLQDSRDYLELLSGTVVRTQQGNALRVVVLNDNLVGNVTPDKIGAHHPKRTPRTKPICTICGITNPIGARICGNCGSSLSLPSPTLENNEQKNFAENERIYQSPGKIDTQKPKRKLEYAQKSTSKIDDIQKHRERLELSLHGLREMKRIRLEEKRELWDVEKEQQELQQQSKREKTKAETRKEKMRMAYELDRLDKLAQVGTEVLIHLSHPEQAALLADLRKTEILKGMSDEQILAMESTNSESLVHAFKQRILAIAKGEMEKKDSEMYAKALTGHSLFSQTDFEEFINLPIRKKK